MQVLMRQGRLQARENYLKKGMCILARQSSPLLSCSEVLQDHPGHRDGREEMLQTIRIGTDENSL